MLVCFFSPSCDEAHKRQPSPLLNFLFVKAGGVTSRCVTEWLIDFSNWFKPHIGYVTFIFKAGPRLSRWKINWSSLYVSLPVRRSVGGVQGYGKGGGGGCADVYSWLKQVRSSVNWPHLLLASVWVRHLYQRERKGNHGGLRGYSKNYITFVLLCSHIFHHLLYVVSSDPSTEKTFWPNC